MSRALRWSEKELQQHLSVRASPGVAAVAPVRAAGPTRAAEARKKANTVRDPAQPQPQKKLSRAKLAAQSLRTAQLQASHRPGEFLDITLIGVKALSVNELYALHHFERIAYRKAWHDTMHQAVLLATGGPRNASQFKTFRVRAHRVSPRGCDVDALNGYFKYAIDGLRYAGIVFDDDPAHMLSMDSTQSRGDYRLRIRIDAVSQDVACDDSPLSQNHANAGCSAGVAADDEKPRTAFDSAAGFVNEAQKVPDAREAAPLSRLRTFPARVCPVP